MRGEIASGIRTKSPKKSGELGVAFIGAGNYGKAVLLPILAKTPGIAGRTIVTSTGPSAMRTAERLGFASAGTDPAEVFADDSVDLVFITTQHDTHAALAEAALRAGKAVWLEKPVGLTFEQVQSVARGRRRDRRPADGWVQPSILFSIARAVREAFAKRAGPMAIQYVIAAGATPTGTWITDPKVGGGRIIGEVCHFIDLCNYLVGDTPLGVQARALGRDPESDDSMMALYSYADGSTASISYLANASSELPKERWEVHCERAERGLRQFPDHDIAEGKEGSRVESGQGASERGRVVLPRTNGGVRVQSCRFMNR